jgi:hypothetical protein
MLRGLESVVAAVLLILVAVLGVVLVYWLFSGYVGRFICVGDRPWPPNV